MQRTHKRIKVTLPVTYAFTGECDFHAQKGTTRDISSSGMCFYTNKPLREGLFLNVKVSKIWNVPRTCVVKWNNLESPNHYRVGVAFQ